jgi:hypothetical protein
MFTTLVHASATVGPSASWIIKFCAAVVAAFVVLVVLAFWATWHAVNPEQQQVCYQMFRDLLEFLRGGRGR